MEGCTTVWPILAFFVIGATRRARGFPFSHCKVDVNERICPTSSLESLLLRSTSRHHAESSVFSQSGHPNRGGCTVVRRNRGSADKTSRGFGQTKNHRRHESPPLRTSQRLEKYDREASETQQVKIAHYWRRQTTSRVQFWSEQHFPPSGFPPWHPQVGFLARSRGQERVVGVILFCVNSVLPKFCRYPQIQRICCS